jgi:eukaryotic-like serine/threonine-protein kinase
MPGRLICPKGHHWDLEEEAPAGGTPTACPICGALCNPAASSVQQSDELTLRGGPSPAGSWTLPGGGALGRVQSSEPKAEGNDANDLPTVPGYEVLERLGAGGMGVVYKARQVVANRVVAVKMLRDAAADLETRFRFVAEAEAAARLQHPNIVQIFEVGEASGRPFLALEFCAGGSLADRLDGTPLPPREAADLIERLAGAIEHAHRAGVVHRDLKPGNILLVSGGVVSGEWSADQTGPPTHHSPLTAHQPKIADFGLARRLDVDQGQTQSGTILGTPSYMSPEQAAGDSKRVGPAADVYALGAILYEMLTGRPPFTGETVYETFRQVREQEPVPPRRLQPKVPRDLETICLKCLQKEPRKRYATADALADDVRNFQEGRPVRARPVSSLERLGKWVRRRPGTAALVGLLGLAVAGALAGGVWYQIRLMREWNRTQDFFRRALRSIDVLLTQVAELDLVDEPHMEQVRRALLEKALAFCEELLASEGNLPVLREQTALARRRKADILRQLGRYDESRNAYARAIGEIEGLVAADPGNTELRRHLADCHNFTGETYRLVGRPHEAIEPYRRALAGQQALRDAALDNPNYLQDLARSRYNLGIVAKDLGRSEEAKVELTESARLLTGLAVRGAADPDLRQHLGRAHLNLGMVLRLTDGPGVAQPVLQKAAGILYGLSREFPRRSAYRHELAAALNNVGNLHLVSGCLEESVSLLNEAYDLLKKLADDFPDRALYHTDLANTCNTLAAALAEMKQLNAADGWWEKAQQQWETLIRLQPEAAGHHGDLGMALGNRGRVRVLQGRLVEARGLLEAGVGEALAALRANPDQPDYRSALRQLCADLSSALTKLGGHTAAREHARLLSGELPARSAGTYHAACLLARCVWVLRAQPTSEMTDREIQLHTGLVRELIEQSPHRAELAKLLDDAAFEPLRREPLFINLLRPAKP